MARVSARLLGLSLLLLAILIPGCQALFAHAAAEAEEPVVTELVHDGGRQQWM